MEKVILFIVKMKLDRKSILKSFLLSLAKNIIDQNIKVNIIGLDFDLEGHVV